MISEAKTIKHFIFFGSLNSHNYMNNSFLKECIIFDISICFIKETKRKLALNFSIVK